MRFGGRVYKIEDLKIIGSLGLDFAEINLLEGGTMIYQPQDLLREAEKWGFTYLVHAPREEDPCDLNRLAGGYFQEILGLFKACRKLSCPLLNIHFWMDSRFIPEKIRDRKREILFAMAREGLRNGVQLCLENLSERPETFNHCSQNARNWASLWILATRSCTLKKIVVLNFWNYGLNGSNTFMPMITWEEKGWNMTFIFQSDRE